MKTLLIIERNKGILHKSMVPDDFLRQDLKKDIEENNPLCQTWFGVCWIEYKNFIIYTNYSNWQMFVE